MWRFAWTSVVLVSAACSNAERPPVAVTGQRAASWSDLRPAVDSTLDAMERKSAAQSLRDEREATKRVVTLLAAFQAEMIAMNMTCDAAMAALTDSVLVDADRLPRMTLGQYREARASRGDRLRRLLEAQRLMRQTRM